MPSLYPSYPPYIPVIKWQKAEQQALVAVEEEIVSHIWPCIEIRGVTNSQQLMGELYHFWKGTALIDYADPSGRLTDRRMKEFESFLALAGNKDYPIIPVLDSRDVLDLSPRMMQLLATFNTVVVRLRAEALPLSQELVDQAESALAFLESISVTKQLIVDLGACTGEWQSGVVNNLANRLRELKGFGFETIHIASGAYPESLAEVTGQAEYPRHDWKLWSNLQAVVPELLLGYSDYGILSPMWTEAVLTKIAKTVALRYTRKGDWLILKATGNTKEDSINLSIIMLNTYSDDFMGADFSLGDRQIATRADPSEPDRKKKGGPISHLTEAWIHHISYVVKEQY
ncbi:beta family protein [Pseudomonas inefficax]|uniref:beta family protein n=1 Tax=Pseudomonas inefficax TaxID=2078786 RepID=UPI0035C575E0